MIVCDYLVSVLVLRSSRPRKALALAYGSVRWVAEGLKQSEALLLIGGSQSLGAENTAGEAFGAPECAGLEG